MSVPNIVSSNYCTLNAPHAVHSQYGIFVTYTLCLIYNPTMCLHTTVPLQSSSDSETALQELLESHSHTLAEFFAQVLQIEKGSTEKDTGDSLSLLELVLVIAGGVGLGLLCGCCVCVAAILVCRRWRRHRK